MFISVGVSQVELSRFYRWLTSNWYWKSINTLIQRVDCDSIPFQARFTKSRRSLSEERERTSVRDRPERMLQRRVREAGAERVLGYMTK